MAKFFTKIIKIIIPLTILLFLASIISAVCCSEGCFPGKNICCDDGKGYVGCQDGENNYYCYGTYIFPVGQAALPNSCLTCSCDSQDSCNWDTNTFCQDFYGSNYVCNKDNPTLPTATECCLDSSGGCPEGTSDCDGCCEEDCNPFHYCGDGICDSDENCASCSSDCGYCPPPTCGDNYCAPNENCDSCSSDCGTCPPDDCGNGYCASPEDCSTCSSDCGSCGSCTGTCGDTCCDANENCASCSSDCGYCPPDNCENGYCAPQEDCLTCETDCGTCPPDTCPDGLCGPTENCASCQDDCGECGCSSQSDNCCNAENDNRCDPDCVEGVDPDCPTPCENTPDDCCNPSDDNHCDTDCIPGVDPDCFTVCKNIADSCCNAEDNTPDICDPDCVEGVDPDCPATCTSDPGDCCKPADDGVCDTDCISGVDPDCSDLACDYDDNCETEEGESCSCADCDFKPDSCASGLVCLDGTCAEIITDCNTCSSCDYLGSTCDYTACTTLCTLGQGSQCYYAGKKFWLGNDCATCSAQTTCEDYEQTESTCNADDCNLNNCVWDTPDCITVDYIEIQPSSLTLPPDTPTTLTAVHYIKDQSYDITSSTTFSSSNPDTTITSNIISTSTDTDITATYGGKTATARITVTSAEEPILSHVTLKPLDAILNKDKKLAYTVTAYYSDGSSDPATSKYSTQYESSNPDVASVLPEDNKNTVTAKDGGVAAITAYYKEGVERQATAKLKVRESGKKLSHIKLTPFESSVKPGITEEYTLTAYYSDNTEQDITLSPFVTYESTNTETATISDNIATGVKDGLTTIVARYEKDDVIKTDTATLEVTTIKKLSKLLAYIAGNKISGINLIIGSKQPFTLDITYSDKTSKLCPPSCEELEEGLIISISDETMADIAYNSQSGKYEATGKKNGVTEAVFSYIEDEVLIVNKIDLVVDEPDTAQVFCELVADNEQAVCNNLETACWAATINEETEYTDKTKCCGNEENELWKYLAKTSTGLFSNQYTCYNSKWYTTASPITYYKLYLTK